MYCLSTAQVENRMHSGSFENHRIEWHFFSTRRWRLRQFLTHPVSVAALFLFRVFWTPTQQTNKKRKYNMTWSSILSLRFKWTVIWAQSSAIWQKDIRKPRRVLLDDSGHHRTMLDKCFFQISNIEKNSFPNLFPPRGLVEFLFVNRQLSRALKNQYRFRVALHLTNKNKFANVLCVSTTKFKFKPNWFQNSAFSL